MSFTIEKLAKSFGGLTLFSDVSATLEEGNIYALFGKNGTGKSTLFNIMTGFQKPDQGVCKYNGYVISGLHPDRIAALGIGRVWQSPRICKNLSIYDNLMLAARKHPGECISNYFVDFREVILAERLNQERAKTLLEEFHLEQETGQLAGALSLGQQKLLSIGMVLMNDSKVILLDEPFTGINRTEIEHLCDILSGLRMKNKLILFIEHNIRMAETIADRVYFLEKGQILTKSRART